MFHRVDPRLRVLKAKISKLFCYHDVHVSSRRPEVEGTESKRAALNALSADRFHRVDPRLRVLKGYTSLLDV